MNDKTNQSGNSDAGSKNSPENAETGLSLDSLLKSFDDEGKSESKASVKTESKPQATSDQLDRLEYLEKVELQRQADAAIDDVTNALEAADPQGDADRARGWLERQARDNPDIQKLILLRSENKSQFDKAVAALVPEFTKGIVNVETPAQKTLGSAIRGARTSQSNAVDYSDDLSELNDAEFAMKSREIIKAAEAGTLT